MKRGKIIVDKLALASNYNLLKSRLKNSECAAVVKANAYGLGAIPVSQVFYEQSCRHFFVAHLDEALEIKPHLPNANIYLLHGLCKHNMEYLFNNNIIPVLNNKEQIALWKEHAPTLPSIIQADTGMCRVGIDAHEIEYLEGMNILYFMSHMACADDKDHPLNIVQLKKFNQMMASLPGIKATLANSSSIFLGSDYHFDLVRPGCALYGVNPTPYQENPMQAVVTVMAPIIQVRELDEKTSVGYGATREMEAGSILAVVEIGYADGYIRSLSNIGNCYIENHEAYIIGRVSMDMIVIDVTRVPKQLLYNGAMVEMVGKNAKLQDVARKAGTIGYEILTDLSRRFEHVYI